MKSSFLDFIERYEKTASDGRWEDKVMAYSSHTLQLWRGRISSCSFTFSLDVLVFWERALDTTTASVLLPHLFLYIIWKFAWLGHSRWQGLFGWDSREHVFSHSTEHGHEQVLYSCEEPAANPSAASPKLLREGVVSYRHLVSNRKEINSEEVFSWWNSYEWINKWLVGYSEWRCQHGNARTSQCGWRKLVGLPKTLPFA